ncbi:Type II/IV secretion system ATP hydrolase TadA/VirB11/CpaF, TadA subfamily [Lachnospiraceae bacterium TWA4]|nr:Type II/IV secretion system ATP hydrolase TadA/VirB11/CpaF, TadA subfamily [Lachnospiraceae bacterium TWA4]
MDLVTFVTDEELKDKIDEILAKESKRNYFTCEDREELQKEIYNSIRGLDVLQELIEDDRVSEIMVNGAKDIFIEKNGCISKWHKGFSSEEKLLDVIQQIVSNVNRIVNESTPIVDARLMDGSRVHAVLKPIALNGPVLTIRKFPKVPIDMRKLIEWKSISEDCVEFLEQLVKAKYNIFISGGTGAGKTTFLNALSQFIPKEERIITIEDSAELQINIPNLVSLEARNKNLEGTNEVSIRDLIRASLRMRPDRIIVGEVRSEEALDMLQAMNTGHDGSISTGHANSSRDMLTRLEMMVLMGAELPLEAIKSQIASALDVLIHLERMRDGSRKVVSVEEVIGYSKGEIILSKIYEYNNETQCLQKTKNSFQNVDKFKEGNLL